MENLSRTFFETSDDMIVAIVRYMIQGQRLEDGSTSDVKFGDSK